MSTPLVRVTPVMKVELRVSWCQLKIPLFLGEDAYGWVSKVERYFDLKVSDAEKLQASMVTVDSKVLV